MILVKDRLSTTPQREPSGLSHGASQVLGGLLEAGAGAVVLSGSVLAEAPTLGAATVGVIGGSLLVGDGLDRVIAGFQELTTGKVRDGLLDEIAKNFGGDSAQYALYQLRSQSEQYAFTMGLAAVISNAGGASNGGTPASTHTGSKQTPNSPLNPSSIAQALTAEEIAAFVASRVKLPPFTGGKTSGALYSKNGIVVDKNLKSGWNGPALLVAKGRSGFDIVTRTHVEGHAAAAMEQQCILEGILEINNPTICQSCYRNLPRMLAPDKSLIIVLPDGRCVTFTGATP
jgi:hypothetical protein